MSALDIQVGGNHYKKYKYQPIEYFMDARLNPLSSNISKYILRYKEKNGLEDLEKALQFAEIGVEKYMRSRNELKGVTANSLKFHNLFINQIDGSNKLEIDILTASIYEDYRLCSVLISDLIDKEYNDKDTFDYFSSLLNLSVKNELNIYKLIHSKRHDSEDMIFMFAFVFVLHKYDVSIKNISNNLKCNEHIIKNVIFKAYELLENNNNMFVFEMETMFNHIDSERLCKK